MATTKCMFNTGTALRRVFMPNILNNLASLHVGKIFVPALLSRNQVRTYQYTGRQPDNSGNYGGRNRYGSDDGGGSSKYGVDSGGGSNRYGADTGGYGNRYGVDGGGGYDNRPAYPATGYDSPESGNRDGYDGDEYGGDGYGGDGYGADDGRPLVRRMDRIQPREKVRKAKLGRLPRDQEITHPKIHIRNDEGESLGEPRYTRDVLAEINLKTHSLMLLVYPDLSPEFLKANPKAPQWPICKIVNKKAERDREKELKANKKGLQNKELELNWATAPNDQNHKVNQLKKFLAKGWRVQVLFLNKQGKKKNASKKEAEELVAKVKAALEEVKGAFEVKASEGELQGTMRMFLQGPTGGVMGSAESSAGEAASVTPASPSVASA